MLNLVAKNPAALERYLLHFRSFFTKKAFENFSSYTSGLFLELKRTNIQTIDEKNLLSKYENLQYFLSEARWDAEVVNEQRIEMLQHSRTTKTCKKGVLALDDTSCKKFSIKTEGAKVQYSPTEGRKTNCNVMVVCAYCDEKKHYPVNLKAYRPKEEFPKGKKDSSFKSKIELAKELVIDAQEKNLLFNDIIFDSWYFANHFVEFLSKHNLSWITEADRERLVSFRGKWVAAGELVKLLTFDKFNRKVTLSNSQGEKRSFRIYSFTTKLKGIPEKLQVVIAKGSWDERDPKKTHIFVTNHLSLSGEEVIRRYALRWGIECIFRDLKENVALDHYQVRSLKAITRHWHLSILAYTFLFWIKQNGHFSRSSPHKLKTTGEYLTIWRKINILSTIQWINKNPHAFQKYLDLNPSVLVGLLPKN